MHKNFKVLSILSLFLYIKRKGVILMTNGLDCATKLTEKMAKDLKKAGFDYVARYLGESWKSFDRKEAKLIQEAGLQLVSIFQKSANHVAYFSEAQGRLDAREAITWAEKVEQPAGTAIYFAVDFDVAANQVPIIHAYFYGVMKELHTYKLGVYGSYRVINAMKDYADYFWQTYAWSRGAVADFIHMHQYENNVTIAGVNIDRNHILKSPGDWWPNTNKLKTSKKSVETYQLKVETEGYLTASDAKNHKNCKGKVKPGTYYIFHTSQGMINITKEQGTPGSWINPTSDKVIYIVQSGDNLTKIAKKYNTTIHEIQAKNPEIKNINLIYPGQEIRI